MIKILFCYLISIEILFANTYKVELINDPFDPNWLGAIAGFCLAIASVIAGFRYLFVEGTLYKHTELDIECKKIEEFDNHFLIEVKIKISNKGKKIMTFFNSLLVINGVKYTNNIKDKCSIIDDNFNEKNNFFEILDQKNIITEEDEYVRLHADTSFYVNSYFLIDKNIKIVKVELWVLYIQRRVKEFKKGFNLDNLENQEFNSIEKIIKF